VYESFENKQFNYKCVYYFLQDTLVLKNRIDAFNFFEDSDIELIFNNFSSVFQYLQSTRHELSYKNNEVLSQLAPIFHFLLHQSTDTLQIKGYTLITDKTLFLMLHYVKEVFHYSAIDRKQNILNQYFIPLCEYLKDRKQPNHTKDQVWNNFPNLALECIQYWTSYYTQIHTNFDLHE